jgi:hypothetical protein
VLTVPACRGKGYGEQTVRAATAFMELDGADVGLFTCDPALRTFTSKGPKSPLLYRGMKGTSGLPLFAPIRQNRAV